MAYILNKYNGSQLVIVDDGTLDNTTSLNLIGKNYAGYGEAQNENFVYLLENFAKGTEPTNPLLGQLWFDTNTNKLRVYDKSTRWRILRGSELSTKKTDGTLVAPVGLSTGEFWYDEHNRQLNVWDGTSNTFVMIGPQGVAGTITEMKATELLDVDGVSHPVIEAFVGDEVVFVISSLSFNLQIQNGQPQITGFGTGYNHVHTGITFPYTDSGTGVTDPNLEYKLWGNSANSDRLGGYVAESFVRNTGATFIDLATFSDQGLTINDKLTLFNNISGVPVIESASNIIFKTTSGSTINTPTVMTGNNVNPGSDNTVDLGTPTNRYKDIYAVNLHGSLTGSAGRADALKVLQNDTTVVGYYPADLRATPISVAARDSNGDITANTFRGLATSANYADLAEKYLTDQEYEAGTVVMVGGEKEVTACQTDEYAIGVVSTNPGFMLNQDLEGGTYIALKGRVPVKVMGNVNKGDKLVPGANGCAIVGTKTSNNIFAIALESSSNNELNFIESVIL